jgi:hypothetical protein
VFLYKLVDDFSPLQALVIVEPLEGGVLVYNPLLLAVSSALRLTYMTIISPRRTDIVVVSGWLWLSEMTRLVIQSDAFDGRDNSIPRHVAA